ncbi:MAG TPA: hypothetical protein VEY11_18040 [Pyrinomonadaceae bacterium]|nr:hypothetical protein [Pyrinomonadaceae bacterium]
MTKYLTVAAGSALGGMLRHYLGGTLLARTTAAHAARRCIIAPGAAFARASAS